MKSLLDEADELLELLASGGEMPPEIKERHRLRDEVEKLLVPVAKESGYPAEGDVWKGHFFKGVLAQDGWYKDKFHDDIRVALLFMRDLEALKKLLAALKEGVELDEPIRFPKQMMSRMTCPNCGESIRFGFDGKRIIPLSNKECLFPEGIVTEFELNVPSGKIVVDDDLRRWFPYNEGHNINQTVGCHWTSLESAKVGCAHGFVGNTCPGVYKDGEDKYVIGNYSEEIWDDEKGDEVPNPKPNPWGEQVASICTDLWWYSIADFDEWERRRQHYTPERAQKDILDHWTFHVVEVKPGVYKFRHDHTINHDHDGVPYATFEWVRHPDPVIDYIAIQEAMHYNATECLIQHCLKFPRSYMGADFGDDEDQDVVKLWESKTYEEQTRCLARATDQIMCVLGGGVDWHENGFPRGNVGDDAVRLAAEYGEIPRFDFKTRWYPISTDYGLAHSAGRIKLAPSFARLALNICQNYIKYGGEDPRDSSEAKYARERLLFLGEEYHRIRKEYPDIVLDEEFDQWMKTVDFKKYVAEFDLGPASRQDPNA